MEKRCFAMTGHAGHKKTVISFCQDFGYMRLGGYVRFCGYTEIAEIAEIAGID